MGEQRRGELTRRLGIAIRDRRKVARMSQEKLAFESGVDRSYLSEVECGLKSPTVETIAVIASALGLKPSELLRLTEE